MKNDENHCPIAVVGMGCRYPGANSPKELWENVLAKRRQFRRMPDCRTPLSDYYHSDPEKPDKTFSKYVAVIDGFNFDWEKRLIPYTTYQSTDIVHWLALEVALTTIADASYEKNSIPSSKTGVIVGNTLTGEHTRAATMRLRWPFVQRALRNTAKIENIPKDTMLKIEKNVGRYFDSISPAINEDSLAGGLSNTIAGRICNYLNLGGGGYTVDGACSSSLLAIATAANGLMNRDLDLVLAGGVDISLDPFEIVGFSKAGALTHDDMRVYDRRANGFFPGEGCGFVLLKRLDDAVKDNNHIYAVLHGWGISSDGKGASITAPNAKGQSRAILRAYAQSPFKLNQIDFIEGHGTGTRVGDQTELEGIAVAINNFPKVDQEFYRFCGMTSLKSIIGHTKAAAGVGAFIKAVMAVNRRILPPTAGCKNPNELFNTKAKNLYPILKGKETDSKRSLHAGVSAMGFGGINCHVCIKSEGSPNPNIATSLDTQSLLASSQETELFIFSGQSLFDLPKQINDIYHESNNISLAEMIDLAADLAKKGDTNGIYRAAIVANHPEQLTERLDRAAKMLSGNPPDHGTLWEDTKNQIWIGHGLKAPRIGFLFPGQGSQQINMAQRLIARYDWAREMLDKADRSLVGNGHEPIGPVVYRNLDSTLGSDRVKKWTEKLTQTEHAQPAICLVSLLWRRWLEKMGVRPTAVGGHSLGELNAFHTAGAFDTETLIRFSAYRGWLFAKEAKGDGAMLSLRCSKTQAEQLLEQVRRYAALSNINSPRQVVVSGEIAAIKQISKLAAKANIPTYFLPVSGGFHTKLVADVAKQIKKNTILPSTLREASCRLFTSIDGQEIKSDLTLKDHFSRQVSNPVNFISMVRSMSQVCDLFIEVGTGRALSGMVNDINRDTGPLCLPLESSSGNDTDTNRLLAILFTQGLDIAWNKLYGCRLVRPFIPPSKRLFFKNPCEQSLGIDVSAKVPSNFLSEDALETLLSNLGDISHDKIENYLKTRGPFLARIIQADLDLSPSETQWLQTSAESKPKNKVESQTADKTIDNDNSIEIILYKTLETITGFSQDTLNPSMNLLDDLNLDSIKTGDLLSRVAKEAGIVGEIAPINYSIVSLGEIAQKLKLTKARKTESFKQEKPDILRTLLDQIAKLFEVPAKKIDPDAVLSTGLKISKNQLKSLLPNISDRISVDIHVDLDPLLKRTLRQIASILERLYEQQQKPVHVDTNRAHRSPWTREFQVLMATKPLSKSTTPTKKRYEDNWQNAHALVIADTLKNNIAKSLFKKLSQLGAKVDLSTHTTVLEKNLMGRSEYSYFFNILNSEVEKTKSTYEHMNLRDIITRLAGTTNIAPASSAPRRRSTLAYIQFGGGTFGTQPETAFFDQCCATAIAASIHQERSDLRIRVIDFSSKISTDIIAEKIIAEVSTTDAFSAAGYDLNLIRRERFPSLMDPGTYRSHPFTWNRQDVILVTGGAKGITAECAFGVAIACGAKMALVGRSPLPDTYLNSSEDNEILKNLKRYAENNLTANYYSCDISNREAVIKMVDKVKKQMGPITGVIHGAGLNIPKVASDVSIEAAYNEVSPKVLGALNLMSELDQTPPKKFIGLTSLSGVTGMHGNAWYGFSNEALDILLNRFKAKHPNTQTLSISYSIWKDEGMGPRMGLVNRLEDDGIGAITTEEGVDRFVRLFLNDPGVNQVIVAARLSGINTWKFQQVVDKKYARFLEEPLHITPGVESSFRAHLSIEKDLYLTDHKFEGSYLFPAVFGLEAMAQAVTHVTGNFDFHRVCIENINLKRSITIDPKLGTDIIIWADVDIQITDADITVVRTGIYQPGIGADSDSFSATFILGLQKKKPTHHIPLPQIPLEINPETDLYRNNLLFQGKSFQRVKTIWELESSEYSAWSTYSTIRKDFKDIPSIAYRDAKSKKMILGDAFFRDSLLQSAALLIPQDTYLPINIDRIDIYPDNSREKFIEINARVEMTRKEDNEIKATIIACKPDGSVVERIEGFRLRFMSHHENNPTASDLINPHSRDNLLIKNKLKKLSPIFKIFTPEIKIEHFSIFEKTEKQAKQNILLHTVEKAVQSVVKKSSKTIDNVKIEWSKTNQPTISSANSLDLEIGYYCDEKNCMVIVGDGPQKCHISQITNHTPNKWIEILGQQHGELLNELTDKIENVDRIGSVILSSLNVARSICDDHDVYFKIIKKIDDAFLFEAGKKDGSSNKNLILSTALLLTRGIETIASFTVYPIQNPAKIEKNLIRNGYDELFKTSTFEKLEYGPQGQEGLIYRIPATFKDSSQLSRTVYFSNYLFWAGKIREASIWPVLSTVGKLFSTGKWGVVTNQSALKILGEATVKDRIEIHLWASKNGGPENSTMELTFDFRKMLDNNNYERLAWCEQTTTWVEVLNHGSVKPSPYPDFYWDLMKGMLPKNNAPNVPPYLPEPFKNLNNYNDNTIIYQAPSKPVIQPLVFRKIIETSLDDANVVGNIYFANYYAWLGRVRDQYFFKIIPSYYRGFGEKGELLCLECKVDHLREAMPFDQVSITMALKTWRTSSVVLHFEFFKIDPDGKQIKLAYGEHKAIWVIRDESGKPIPKPFPKPVKRAFEKAISNSS